MDACPMCAATAMRLVGEGKSADEAYRKSVREHADGKHPAPVDEAKPIKSSR